MNRRSWLKRGSALGAMSLIAAPALATSLTREEKIAYNPRPFAKPATLHFNENPFGPSKKVREAMHQNFDLGCRYPSQVLDDLASKIATKEGVTPDHIVIGAGSTEGLKITGLTYANNGGEIIAARPTFLAMLMYAEQWGGKINWVDLDKDMRLDVDEMEKRISSKTELIFLCNPNNPTSTLLPKDQLVDFVETASEKTIVFSDEAYYDFIEEPNYPSMVDKVKQGKDVIVSKTFSKVYGLAGLRIGYLVAKPSTARRLRQNMVANTNMMAITGANAAMEDKEFYDFSIAKNKEAKSMMRMTMDDLGLKYADSHTNFLFFETGMDIERFNRMMLDEGVQVGRPFPPYRNWCRVSTGLIEEVEMFNAALRKIVG